MHCPLSQNTFPHSTVPSWHFAQGAGGQSLSDMQPGMQGGGGTDMQLPLAHHTLPHWTLPSWHFSQGATPQSLSDMHICGGHFRMSMRQVPMSQIARAQ